MLSLLPLLVLSAATPVLTPSLTFENSNRLRIAHGVLSDPLDGDVKQAALAWANAHAASLGLPVGSTLTIGRGYSTQFGGSVHLLQTVNGVTVLNAKVVVTIDTTRRVSLLTSSLVPYTTIRAQHTIEPDEAAVRAARSVPFPAMRRDGKPFSGHTVTWFLVGDELHAGFWVYVPTLNPVERWHAAVDAVTGEVLRTVNLTLSAKNDAHVYAHSPGGLDAGVGITPTINASLTYADGGAMVVSNDGGFLVGRAINSYNCCINQNCDPDAGVNRAMGTSMQMGVGLTYDSVYCARTQLASNDSAKHPSGDYVYTPVDPPTLPTVNQADPTASDPFAEVHAFFHTNKMHEWAVALSSTANTVDGGLKGQLEPFALRGMAEEGKKLTTWSNVVVPDFSSLDFSCFVTPPCRFDNLSRTENAFFAPLGSGNPFFLPEYAIDGEALILFQGQNADYSYDATVMRHEFGHGVIDATSGLQPLYALDSRSANQEGVALNEGFADFLASAFGGVTATGPYIAPRYPQNPQAQVGDLLRDVENTLSCPGVLWGEPHQDSQHVSAALWEARKTHFLGNDNGATFDAAFYAALVAMGPQVDFASAAEVIAVQVAAAFPTVPQAAQKMRAIFDARGVTHCSKVLDVTGAPPRAHYVIGGPNNVGANNSQFVPGPLQMKLKVPKGTQNLVLTADASANGFGGAPTVRLLAKFEQPILFTFAGGMIINDAAKMANAVFSQGGAMTAALALNTACDTEREVYFTLGSSSPNGAALSNLSASITVDPSCEETITDAGTHADGGQVETDGGTQMMPPEPQPIDSQLGKPAAGCGCQTTPVGWALLALAALGTQLRRRPRAKP